MAFHWIKCEECGAAFKARRSHARRCSAKCRKRASRATRVERIRTLIEEGRGDARTTNPPGVGNILSSPADG